MMLIESDEAIAEINGLLDACVAGRGGVAVITGPVASGKSALMRVAAERAVEAGAWFLGASCSYAQQDVQLGVVNQLLRSLPSLESPPWSVAEQADDRGRLPYPAAQPPGGSRSGSARPACARADEQLNRVVLDVTARRPLVLGVDDVHHADTQSLRCLVRLASRARSLPLLILAAGSTRDQPGCAPLQADLLAEPECRNIRLRLLSLAGIGEMLAQQLGDQATPDLTADFHALTGGSPGLIRALIEDLGHAKAGTPQPVIGPAFRQALMSCLSRTNRHMLPLARGIALLGELAEPALMSTLTSLDTGQVIQGMHLMGLTGLLHEGRFRHPAVQAAVLDAMAPGERSRLHGQAARLRHESGAATAVVAQHLLAADEFDGAWGDVLHEAAETALGAGDVCLARRCLLLAHQSAADESQRARARSALARAEWRINPAHAVPYTSRLVEDVRRGHLAGRPAILPISSLLWFGHVTEALEALEALEAPTRGEVQEETRAAAQLARVLISYAYPAMAARVLPADRAERLMAAASVVHPELQAFGLLETVMANGPSDASAATAERIIRNTRLNDTSLMAIMVSLLALLYCDRLRTAALWCDARYREAESVRARTWQAVFGALRAAIACRQGDLVGAERHGRAALLLIPPKSWGVAVGFPLSALIEAGVGRGRPEKVARYLRVPIPDGTLQTPAGLLYLRARGKYRRAAGHLAGALEDFRTCGELMMRWRMDYPTLIPWRSEAAGILVRMGRTRYARLLMREQLMLLSQPPLGGREFSEAAYPLVPGRQMPPPGPRYVATPAAPRSLGADDGAPRAGPDPVMELSPAERRVAGLAAHGLTNRQIATKLFVTESTVEQHLTRVYRKLQVRRRDHLPFRLFAEADDYL